MSDVDNGRRYGNMEAEYACETSVHFSQLCYKSKINIKRSLKAYILKVIYIKENMFIVYPCSIIFDALHSLCISMYLLGIIYLISEVLPLTFFLVWLFL